MSAGSGKHGDAALPWRSRRAEDHRATADTSTGASRWAPSTPQSSSGASRWAQNRASEGRSTNHAAGARTPRSQGSQAGPPANSIIGSMPASRKFGGAAAQSHGQGTPMRKRDAGKPLGGIIDQMALLASPSRGFDDAIAIPSAGGQSKVLSLSDEGTQDEFRTYISERIASHRKKHGVMRLSCTLSQSPTVTNDCRQSLEELVLLVRKLREALMACHRVDALTTDVYMLSVLLSLVSSNAGQFATAMPRLVDGLLADGSDLSAPALDRLRRDCAQLVDGADLPFSLESSTQLDFFASLYLLTHAVDQVVPTAKGKERASDVMLLQARLDELVGADAAASRFLRSAKAISASLRAHNMPALRHAVVRGAADGSLTPWHFVVLRRGLAHLQTRTWSRLKAAYMSVTLPSYTAQAESGDATPPSWLERLLLIDELVDPVSATADAAPATASETTSQVRVLADRLAHVLQAQGLATAGASAPAVPSDGEVLPRHRDAVALRPWRSRLKAMELGSSAPAALAGGIGPGGRCITLQIRG